MTKIKGGHMNIKIDFSKYSDAELIDLNQQIFDLIKARHALKNSQALARFDLGDRVQFKTSDGKTIKGTIIRVNKKTVSLHSDDHMNWKVSPSFLCKVVERKENSVGKNNLFLLGKQGPRPFEPIAKLIP